MRLPSVPPAPLDSCPTCYMPQKNHPRHCECNSLACRAVALYDVRRGHEQKPQPRCERHLRADLLTAERFSQVIMIQTMRRQPVLI